MARVLTLSINPALDLSVGLTRLALGAVNRADGVELTAAGKGVNMARVLAALGHDVCVTGFLGSDNDAPFVGAFAAMGVEDACLRLAGSTRINTKLSERDGRVTDINAPGLAVTDGDWTRLVGVLDERIDDATRRPEAVAIAGSLAPGVSPQALGRLVASLRERDVAVWVDTSGDALAAAIEAGASAAKPNVAELAEWAGRSLDSPAAERRAALDLYGAGVGETLVSAGDQGVTWISHRGVWQALPPRVDVVSTVCAGDTLFAAMLHGVLEGLAPDVALRFATALSAEAVRHVGVGDSRADDFSTLVQDTRVRRLNDVEAGGVFA
ncbi:1-phosphofructokinase family hexose kinase [Halomonas sp. V046]|uniref:1-phosphofructokinase family hexose kinase n=1 Tax=Halomonas sp. V046 TaxID=3459611 RepID=UPI004045007B